MTISAFKRAEPIKAMHGGQYEHWPRGKCVLSQRGDGGKERQWEQRKDSEGNALGTGRQAGWWV